MSELTARTLRKSASVAGRDADPPSQLAVESAAANALVRRRRALGFPVTGNLPLIGAIPALVAGGFSYLRSTGAERTGTGTPRVHVANHHGFISAVGARHGGSGLESCRRAYLPRVELHQFGGPAFGGTFGLSLQLKGSSGEQSERHSDTRGGSQFGGHSSIHISVR
jgi:hypothetical protein